MKLLTLSRAVLLMLVSLLAGGSLMGQRSLSECEVIPDKEVPAYKIGPLRRKPNETPALLLYVTVGPASFKTASMRALGHALNQRFCNDRTIEAIIVDDNRATSEWDPVHVPELYAAAVRGSYLLDRDSGKEYIAFSSARGRGFDEFVSLAPPDEQPTPRTYTNAYRNPNYGFSVVVPTSLTGTSTVPEDREGGINIPLTTGGSRYIWVGATENTFNFSSLWWATSFQRLWIELDGSKIVSFTRDPHYRLGNLNGTRLTVRYKVAGSSTVMVKDFVFAFKTVNGEPKTLFRVELRSTETDYAKDKRIFEQLVKSWRS